MFRKGVVCNRDYIQVIQPGKDRFLADPQAAGDHCKLQIIVGLQGRLEQRPDQAHHPVIKAAEVSVFQGNVVFINKNN